MGQRGKILMIKIWNLDGLVISQEEEAGTLPSMRESNIQEALVITGAD